MSGSDTDVSVKRLKKEESDEDYDSSHTQQAKNEGVRIKLLVTVALGPTLTLQFRSIDCKYLETLADGRGFIVSSNPWLQNNRTTDSHQELCDLLDSMYTGKVGMIRSDGRPTLHCFYHL